MLGLLREPLPEMSGRVIEVLLDQFGFLGVVPFLVVRPGVPQDLAHAPAEVRGSRLGTLEVLDFPLVIPGLVLDVAGIEVRFSLGFVVGFPLVLGLDPGSDRLHRGVHEVREGRCVLGAVVYGNRRSSGVRPDFEVRGSHSEGFPRIKRRACVHRYETWSCHVSVDRPFGAGCRSRRIP